MNDSANNIVIISISSDNVILYIKENSDYTTFPNISYLFQIFHRGNDVIGN